jgi:hypothetical protein
MKKSLLFLIMITLPTASWGMENSNDNQAKLEEVLLPKLPNEIWYYIAGFIVPKVIENYDQFEKGRSLIALSLTSRQHHTIAQDQRIHKNFPRNIASDEALKDIMKNLNKKDMPKDNSFCTMGNSILEALNDLPNLQHIDERECASDKHRNNIREALITLLTPNKMDINFSIQGKPLLFFSMMIGDIIISDDLIERKITINPQNKYTLYVCNQRENHADIQSICSSKISRDYYLSKKDTIKNNWLIFVKELIEYGLHPDNIFVRTILPDEKKDNTFTRIPLISAALYLPVPHDNANDIGNVSKTAIDLIDFILIHGANQDNEHTLDIDGIQPNKGSYYESVNLFVKRYEEEGLRLLLLTFDKEFIIHQLAILQHFKEIKKIFEKYRKNQ